MRRLLLVLTLALLAALPVCATTTQLIGTLTDSTGTPVSGTACLRLPVNAIDTSTNRALSPQTICFSLVNGTFPAFASVVPNDKIQPANTYYQFKATNQSGGLVFMANYVIPTASGTFNIGLAIPTNVTTSNISYVAPAVTNGPNTFCCTQTFLGQIVSTLATGTAPFSITSTTLVPNLNVNVLNGVTVTGSPLLNYILTATSTTTANWQPAPATLSAYTNNATGTTVNLLAKLTGAPSTVTSAVIADTGGVIGICASGCGASGTAFITTVGQASCVFDGATTAGDYVQISPSINGNCRDAGSTFPNTGQVLGRVLSTNGASGTYNITLFGTEIKGPNLPTPLVIKTGRNSTVCSTGAGAGASCTTTVTWNGGAFADTNYEASCSGIGPTQFPFYMGITSQLAASVTVQLTNGTASEAQISTFTAISCVGVHN